MKNIVFLLSFCIFDCINGFLSPDLKKNFFPVYYLSII